MRCFHLIQWLVSVIFAMLWGFCLLWKLDQYDWVWRHKISSWEQYWLWLISAWVIGTFLNSEEHSEQKQSVAFVFKSESKVSQKGRWKLGLKVLFVSGVVTAELFEEWIVQKQSAVGAARINRSCASSQATQAPATATLSKRLHMSIELITAILTLQTASSPFSPTAGVSKWCTSRNSEFCCSWHIN